MLNTVQFLTPFLQTHTVVRLQYIVKQPFLTRLIKTRLGYVPYCLRDFVSTTESIILYRKMSIHYHNQKLCVSFNDAFIKFEIFVSNETPTIILMAYHVSFRHVATFKTIMKTLRRLFQEFYTNTCVIMHSVDLHIEIITPQDSTLILPIQIKCTILEKRNLDCMDECELNPINHLGACNFK